MLDSLKELDTELGALKSRLHVFYGPPKECLEQMIKEAQIDAVYTNTDYTPFSKSRDKTLEAVCKKFDGNWNDYHDALLHIPESTLKDDGMPYTVFTPFYKSNSQNLPARPSPLQSTNFGTHDFTHERPLTEIIDQLSPARNPNIAEGGRTNGLLILDHNLPGLGNYNQERDLLAVKGTSHLSPHHKFGTISIRESFWRANETLAQDNRFIPELYWRDFFTTVAHYFPHVFKGAFQKRFDSLEWDQDQTKFERWCNGETGFPIVDAGMRELNQTGYMHNRTRMVTASFLVKDLHISWQEGERYFATKLTDYDPCVNNGSWQWAASTGCDAQPYFRIFNPWLQQKKFDPECIYIKRWIPELRELSAEEIHNLDGGLLTADGYPPPMLNHALEKKITEERYGLCAKAT